MEHHAFAIGLILAFLCLEYARPFYMETRRTRFADDCVNVGFFVLNRFISKGLFLLFLYSELLWTESHSFGLLYLLPQLPGWVRLALALALFDLWVYAFHRACHTIPFMWRFHRVHHTDHDIDFTSLYRVHPGEQIMCMLGQGIAIPLIGLTLPEVLAYAALSQLVGLFYHSNVALPEKWDRFVRLIFVSQHMHRIHHLPIHKDANSNYATVFSFWDRVFRSFRLRTDDVREVPREVKPIRNGAWPMFRRLMKAPLSAPPPLRQ